MAYIPEGFKASFPEAGGFVMLDITNETNRKRL